MANFKGTSGDDNLVGTSGNDNFNLTQGGDDIVQGLDGRDLFSFGAAFNASDQVDGGAGNDIIRLDGDYSAGIAFNPNTMVNVEEMQLIAGHDYKLTTDDANLAGGTFTVSASTLGAADWVNFNGADEGDASFKFLAGAGNDVLRGGAMADTFDLSQGGNDQAVGGAGNDVFDMGAALTAGDHIDGGTGSDTVALDGDYAAGLTLGGATLARIEAMKFAAGHDYVIYADDSLVPAGGTFTVDASALKSPNGVTFDDTSETDGHFAFIGGAGDDTLTGGTAGNSFDLSNGGHDIATGGTGSDTFTMGAAFDRFDQIDGGGGSDVVALNGDYSGATALVFRTATMTDVDTITLTGNHAYDITLARATTLDNPMLIDAYGAGFHSSVTLDDSAGTVGIAYHAGKGDNIFTGTAFADIYVAAGNGGQTHFSGNDGNDTVELGRTFTAGDTIDGGAGIDTVTLGSELTLTLGPATITNVETLILANGDDITNNDAMVAAGQTMTVSLSGTGHDTAFDGSAETDGHFHFITAIFAPAVDTIVGGQLSDSFDIGGGRTTNEMTGGGGGDVFDVVPPTFSPATTNVFVYNSVSDSTSTGYDTITGLLFGAKTLFHVSPVTTVTGVDSAVVGGSLSTATFDSDLANDVGAGDLAAHHAVLFVANAGTLSGHSFLVIDANGVAGYQAGADLVIDVTGVGGTPTTAEFT